MKQTIRAVCLRTVKYSDRHNILTVWSPTLGAVALLIGAGAGAEARRRRALTMPLSLIEGEVDPRPGREVMHIAGLRPLATYAHTATSPARATIAMFLAEVLTALLRQTPPEGSLWRFLCRAVDLLGTQPGEALPAFPLWFMAALAHPLGIAPDATDYTPGMAFSLTQGRFEAAPAEPALNPHQTRIMRHLLCAATPRRAAMLHLGRAERRHALDLLLNYYSLHLAPLPVLHSLPIVRAL